MAIVIKIRLSSEELRYQFDNNLKDQLMYFNIVVRVGGISRRSWIKIGNDNIEDFINKHNGGEEKINWIELIGFSRIDGYPMFRIDIEDIETNGKWLIDILRNYGFTTISIDGTRVNYISDNNMEVMNVSMLEDHIPKFFGEKIKNIKRVYSSLDPYGEEDWDDENMNEIWENQSKVPIQNWTHVNGNTLRNR